MEVLQIAARMASTVSVAVIFATPVFIAINQCDEPREKVLAATQRLREISLTMACVFVITQFLLMRIQYGQIADTSIASSDYTSAMIEFVLFSLPGQVWMVRVFLALLIIGWLVASWRKFGSKGEPANAGVALMAGMVILLGVLTGHYSGEQSTLQIAHGLHLIALSLWIGGLVPWLVFAITLREESFAASRFTVTMRSFSILAMASVAVVIVTGLLLSYRFIDTQGDLLGTSWGQWLFIKVLVVAAVMWTANRVRRAMNAGHLVLEGQRRRAILTVGVEFTLVLAVIFAASAISLSTPASHDAAQWWLPFRVSLDAIWDDKALRHLAVSSLFMLGLAIIGWTLAKVLSRRRTVVAAWGTSVLLFGAVAGWSASVPAFPDSFRRSDIAYMAESIASGAALYEQHCQSCHGTGGRGDGALAKLVPKRPPADLSAPHTALHTAGDMYWWLSHGIPQSGMPGFSGLLSPQDRWDLVNFLRAFSQGFQARVISGEVIRNDAWLAAPDFNVKDAGSLKRWRGISPVVIMLAGTTDDVAAMVSAMDQSGGSMPFVLVSKAKFNALPRGFHVPQDPVAVEASYALLSRTIDFQGEKADLVPPVERAIFVVDRYGYLRARLVWRADMSTEIDPEHVVLAVERLAGDTMVPPEPDDHIH